MPNSQIFAVNNSGRVFTLLTNEKRWQELEYLGIEFKKVCAHELVVWALGGDHQIYVYVYGTTVPIRVCEEAYENQRWRPTEGFSHHLLPTDRAAFSSADGLTERTLVGIHLPTLAWQWEGPWTIHTTLAGQQLSPEGWMYALDFPRTYSPSSCWNSCVRRRRWTRYRRYVALNTWSAVPSIHQDYTQEPFIDISVGGGEVMGVDPDVLMVWGVTALGKVMVRTGASSLSPEGSSWEHVPTPPQHDVIAISVGRSGRVWAVTWDGRALVRTGVSRENILGLSWQIVESPPHSPLASVGVGVNAVWGCGRDHSVWFRRGLESGAGGGEEADEEQAGVSLLGSVWLSLAGQRLSTVAVGPDDQVWGVTSGDYAVVMRSGVCAAELTGKTWQSVDVPVMPYDADAAERGSDDSSDNGEVEPGPVDSVTSLRVEQESVEEAGRVSPCSATSLEQTMTELCRRWEGELQEQDQGVAGGQEVWATLRGDVAANDSSRGDQSKHSIIELKQGVIETTVASSIQEQNTDSQGEDDDYESATDDSMVGEFETGATDLVDGTCASALSGKPHKKKHRRKKLKESSAVAYAGLDRAVPLPVTSSGAIILSDTASSLPYAVLHSVDLPPPLKDQPLISFSSTLKSTTASSQVPPVPATPPQPRSRHPSTGSESSSTAALHKASALGLRGTEQQCAGAGDGLPLLQEHLWLGVTGGGCWVHPGHWPDCARGVRVYKAQVEEDSGGGGCVWHVQKASSSQKPHLGRFSGGSASTSVATWRADISYQLYELQRRLQPLRSLYREAVQGGSWTVSGQCRYLAGGHWRPATAYLTVHEQETDGVSDECTPEMLTPETEQAEERSSSSSGSGSVEDKRLGRGRGAGNARVEPVMVIEYTSRSKVKFSLSMPDILLLRLHVQPPSRCLLALYCRSRPHEPYCLQWGSEQAAEEWADNLACAIWQQRQAQAPASPTRAYLVPALPRKLIEKLSNQARIMNHSQVVKGYNECVVPLANADTKSVSNESSNSYGCSSSVQSSVRDDKLEWEARQQCSANKHRPTPYTVWVTALDGSAYFHDSAGPVHTWCCATGGEHRLPVLYPSGRRTYPLLGGFTEGCSVAITFTVDDRPERLQINLQSSAQPHCTVALHFNPRISKKSVVLNSRLEGSWGAEERHKLPAFTASSRNTLLIVCHAGHYELVVNGRAWHRYDHRVSASCVHALLTDGDMTVTSVTYTHLPPMTVFAARPWEGVGGHLVLVAAGAGGVTWALSNDCHAYTYTGGRGGLPYKTLSSLTSHGLVHAQSDVVHDYVWENQRWNPVTGFSGRGLPTDRPGWTQHSAPTLPLTREEVKLPSRHWCWTSEWSVDYHPPGGCDSEGWQHATDFPLSYHGHCYVTDLVRRRRWKRRRRVSTSGPWLQLGRTPLVHVDVASRRSSDGSIAVWGVSVSGEVLLRTGVTPECPDGVGWCMLHTDHPMSAVCVDMGPCMPDEANTHGTKNSRSFSSGGLGSRPTGDVKISPSSIHRHCQVWGVTRDGRAMVRLGVTATNPTGIQWADVDAPGAPLRVVQAGGGSVWGLDQQGGLYRRLKTQPLFLEGTSWDLVCGGLKDLSVSSDGEVWAVLTLPRTATAAGGVDGKDKGSEETGGMGTGMLARRTGITSDTPNGTDWEYAAGTGWSTVSAKMILRQQ